MSQEKDRPGRVATLFASLMAACLSLALILGGARELNVEMVAESAGTKSGSIAIALTALCLFSYFILTYLSKRQEDSDYFLKKYLDVISAKVQETTSSETPDNVEAIKYSISDVGEVSRGVVTKFVSQDEVIRQFDLSSQRLSSEVSALEKKANVNVLIGSFSALSIMLYSFIYLSANFGESILAYIPLVTTILVIEIFSFFFLKLYRKCLDDIKFYQNEISNIEHKKIAYLIALKAPGVDFTVVVQNLMNAERNFVLDKGQTTVDSQRALLDDAVVSKLAGVLSKQQNKI